MSVRRRPWPLPDSNNLIVACATKLVLNLTTTKAMRTPSLIKTFGIGTALSVFAIAGSMAQTAVTDPVGFITLSIAGGSTAAPGISFLGLGMTQPVSFAGNLESVSGTTVTDLQSTWTDGQYEGANGSYYLELTSGGGAGTVSDIVTTSGANHSLTLADDLSGLIAAGATYKIRPNWTLASVFGSTNSAGLGTGSSTTADQVLVYNTSSQGYTTFYYQTSGLGGTGWRKVGAPATDASGSPLHLQQGIILKRYVASAISLPLVGAVKVGQNETFIATGTNIVSNIYPVTSVTLGSSGLYTGSTSTGVAGGNSTSADQVLVYNGSGYSTYYYQTSGLGGTGWRLSGQPGSDASSAALPLGGSVSIQRKFTSPFIWTQPQPF